MITPFNRNKLIEDLREQATGYKEMGGILSFSDAAGDVWRAGKRIKSYTITPWNDEWRKNVFNRVREGGFFPHQHTIENKHVTEIFKQLQIYPVDYVPKEPDTCFIDSLKGRFPTHCSPRLRWMFARSL